MKGGRKRYRISIATLFFGGAAIFLAFHSLLVFLYPSEGENEAVPKPLRTNGRTVTTTTQKNVVHLAFSTDCSGYQHWQGISLYYSARRAGHIGPVTRIASGCSEEKETSIKEEWSRIDPSGRRFRVHFTPTFALPGGYKYSNKPGGIRHWILHADPPVDEGFICLIDPDMLLLRPITIQLRYGLAARQKRGRKKQVEYVDSNGTARLLRTAGLPELSDVVRKGSPAGQHFGVGGSWVSTPNPRRPAWQNFSKSFVCGTDSACTRTSRSEADERYAVGPVYLASREDWLLLADKWWDFVPRVHSQYPFLLAEMMAYTMSAADLELRFNLLSSYMVSDPGTQSPTEAWSWIDDIAVSGGVSAVCEGANSTTLPAATRSLGDVPLPTTLHFCQRYKFAGHLFAKHKVAHDFFKCDGKPMHFDVNAILAALENEPTPTNVRTAFMICHLIPLINSGLAEYQQTSCSHP